MWWDDETIEKTVTRQFVCSHLIQNEIELLDKPVGFGDGLTDETYWEWIEEKAKRIFLTLVDLGVPDQIFGVVDDSWDDSDLPIALDQVERLALTPAKDERSEKKFYYRQFYYILRPLRKGDHGKYQDDEVIPLDLADKRPGLGNHHAVDKVTLPGQPGKVFCRRRIPLGSGQGFLSHEDFQFEVNSVKNIQHDHLVSYWASYTHRGYGYILFTPASDYSLKSFLTTTPAGVKNMDKMARRRMVFNWIHCLVDTLCYIHNRGLSHGNIKPSTVLFNNEHHVFFADFTRFNTELMAIVDKTSFDKESYDYAAPEQWFKPSQAMPTSPIQRKATLPAVSTSPEGSYTFSIARSNSEYGPHSPMAMMNTPAPHLNAQAADIFSLGCVILELLSFLLKKQGRPFAAHRAAKHKSAGRGGAVLDSSFHKNLTQVETWMTQLAKEAAKKDDQVFRGFTPMLHLVERMLAPSPADRPAAHDVQTRMYQVLTEACGIQEPHCVHQYGGWDFGLGRLKLKTQPPVLSDNGETMTIANKRTSNSHGFYHRRNNSGNSGHSSGSSGRKGGVASPREPSSPLGGTFEALQGVRSRDKVRPGWQSPVYAGKAPELPRFLPSLLTRSTSVTSRSES